MSEEYPYSELEVFVAGYQRGRSFVQACTNLTDADYVINEELASRRLTMYDLTWEGLVMLGMRADFVPREIFDAGVRRAVDDAT